VDGIVQDGYPAGISSILAKEQLRQELDRRRIVAMPSDFLFRLRIGGAIIALGALLLGTWRTRMAARWPAAEGTIEDAQIQDVKEGSNLGGYKNVLVVSYSYQVDGRFYGGSQEFGYRPGMPVRTLVGSKVQVRYKPNKPDTSRLISDPSLS
jgi:hypothetical protein